MATTTRAIKTATPAIKTGGALRPAINIADDMAAAIIAALPTLLVYMVAGRFFVRGLTAGAVKG